MKAPKNFYNTVDQMKLGLDALDSIDDLSDQIRDLKDSIDSLGDQISDIDDHVENIQKTIDDLTIPEGTYIKSHAWDFKTALTDTVGSIDWTVSAGATQTASGIEINGAGEFASASTDILSVGGYLEFMIGNITPSRTGVIFSFGFVQTYQSNATYLLADIDEDSLFWHTTENELVKLNIPISALIGSTIKIKRTKTSEVEIYFNGQYVTTQELAMTGYQAVRFGAQDSPGSLNAFYITKAEAYQIAT